MLNQFYKYEKFNTWNNIKSNTVDKAHSLFTGVRSKFTSLWNATKDIFTKLRNWMTNIWNSIKDNTVGIAGRGTKYVVSLEICVTV